MPSQQPAGKGSPPLNPPLPCPSGEFPTLAETAAARRRRPLGTMIAYGFARGHVETDLAIAQRLGATCVEALPDWRTLPDPATLANRLADTGMTLHSAHGCWGGQSIVAPRVDLGSLDPATWSASLDDLKRCLDWLGAAGGTVLVVHPGGLSDPADAPARRDALGRGLVALADHLSGTNRVACVENMPPGVHPGSRMADLAGLVAEIGRPEIALALDTGHAHIAADAAAETLAAGTLLRTTHVHDNDGRHDSHLPPGLGSLDWVAWQDSLEAISYEGPVMLECIRHLRDKPESLTAGLLALLEDLTLPPELRRAIRP